MVLTGFDGYSMGKGDIGNAVVIMFWTHPFFGPRLYNIDCWRVQCALYCLTIVWGVSMIYLLAMVVLMVTYEKPMLVGDLRLVTYQLPWFMEFADENHHGVAEWMPRLGWPSTPNLPWWRWALGSEQMWQNCHCTIKLGRFKAKYSNILWFQFPNESLKWEMVLQYFFFLFKSLQEFEAPGLGGTLFSDKFTGAISKLAGTSLARRNLVEL